MNNKNVSKNDFVSVAEAAKIMGYTRQHVLRLIYNGKIEAEKIGRSFAVNRKSLGGLYKPLSPLEKKEVDQAVDKIFKEYGDVIKKLGKE